MAVTIDRRLVEMPRVREYQREVVECDARFKLLLCDENPVVTEGPLVSLGTDLPAGQQRTLRVMVRPPVLPLGSDKQQHQLHLDLWDDDGDAWFGNKGNPPSEQPIQVNKKLKTKLGLEPYYRYATESLGAGMTHLVNVANGNSLLTWTPFAAPGRGPGTVVNLTYNSLEKKSESPVGAGWSLALSGLTRLGQPLDIHPNNADTISGRSNRWVEFTDADGSTHRFEGELHGDGTVFWKEPAGVHLYLRVYSTTDSERKWALSTPGRTTFFYDADGYPTYVEDNNGNRLKLTLETTPPGEDPGGPKKRVTKVTDAAGLNADGTVNPAVTTRSFTITYYSKAEAKKAHVRGKVKRITDHDGSALDFEYYDDGNLRKIIQRGGTSADGSFLADRQFVFTYTTSSGDEAALPNAADRIDPDPGERNQSHQLYSVRDPRGAETLFTYHGPPTSQNRWKLATRTDRAGQVTSFAYDTTTRVTTITAPLSRVTKHTYDADGKVTKTNNALQQDTLFEWNPDFQVTKVTEPTGKFVEMTYDANGAVTSSKNQLGQTTTLEYQYVAADANDASGKWKTGRTHAHIGQLVRRTAPKGVLTATPTDDYQQQFVYDARGNLTESSDSEQRKLAKKSTFAYNADGTLASSTDANGRVTSFYDYDANGFATRVVDAAGGTSRRGYSDDGRLLWTQDAAHASDTGADVRSYRTYIDYDLFGRPVRTSVPKSTLHDRGMLIWTGTAYDANGNVVAQTQPHESRDGFLSSKPATTLTLDAMDRRTLITGPDKSIDPAGERTQFVYDAAGRLTRTVGPKGMLTATPTWDHATDLTYDALGRVTKQVQYETGGAEQRTFSCFDMAGDLRTVTPPRANVTSVDCAAAVAGTNVPPLTMRYTYDDAHRGLTTTAPTTGTQTATWTVTYDANGNVQSSTAPGQPSATTRYDEANRAVETTQPYVVDANGTVTRSLTTRLEFDAAGNLKREVSPRAWDANPGLTDYSGKPYVTTYQYDSQNRVERVDLPTDAQYSEQHYVHRKYDALGRLEWVSLPTTQPTRDLVLDTQKTKMTYWDAGSQIRTLQEANHPAVYFEYKDGRQVLRAPLQPGAPNQGPLKQGDHYELAESMRWEYDTAGRLKAFVTGPENSDRRNLYDHEADGQVKWAQLTTGVERADETAITVWTKYDGSGRPEAIRHKRDTDPCRITTFQYYPSSNNLWKRFVDGTTTFDSAAQWCAETAASAGQERSLEYDDANRITREVTPEQQISYDYTAQGWLRERAIADGAGQAQLRTTWDYFANGLVKGLSTYTGAGALAETHAASYDDPGTGTFVGHRTQDRFAVASPGPGPQCATFASPCTATNRFDARGRLVYADLGYGGQTRAYTLDPSGNVTREVAAAGSQTTTTHYSYGGQQVATADGGFAVAGVQKANQLTSVVKHLPDGAVSKEQLFYDRSGSTDCITTDTWAGTACPLAPAFGGETNPVLRVDYAYDRLQRLETFRIWAVDAGVLKQTDDARYAYDALDRPTLQAESHVFTGVDPNAAPQRTTTFSYEGLSTRIRQEVVTGETAFAGTKTYTVDAYGQRARFGFTPSGSQATEWHSYGLDLHANVSLLLRDGGTVKATYGYDPYGASVVDPQRWTDTADHSGSPSTAYADLIRGDHLRQDPLNPIRYNAKRLSSGDGGLDFGARRFSSDYKRFYQRDSYTGSQADLGLSTSAWNANRYALAGGNPVTGVDLDGHYAIFICGFNTECGGSDADKQINFGPILEALDVESVGGAAVFNWNADEIYRGERYATLRRPVTDGARVLVALLEQLYSRGVRDFQLIGHSKGGALIMELLAQIAEGRIDVTPALRAITAAVALSSPISDPPSGHAGHGLTADWAAAIGFSWNRIVCDGPLWGRPCRAVNRLETLRLDLAERGLWIAPFQVAALHNAADIASGPGPGEMTPWQNVFNLPGQTVGSLLMEAGEYVYTTHMQLLWNPDAIRRVSEITGIQLR